MVLKNRLENRSKSNKSSQNISSRIIQSVDEIRSGHYGSRWVQMGPNGCRNSPNLLTIQTLRLFQRTVDGPVRKEFAVDAVSSRVLLWLVQSSVLGLLLLQTAVGRAVLGVMQIELVAVVAEQSGGSLAGAGQIQLLITADRPEAELVITMIAGRFEHVHLLHTNLLKTLHLTRERTCGRARGTGGKGTKEKAGE